MSDSKFVLVIIVFALLALTGIVVFRDRLKSPPPQLLGREYVDDDTRHLSANEPPVTYKTNPPVSGPHDSEAADWGFYEQELPDTKAIHNLEHGGIWLSYQPDALTNDQKEELKELADKYDQRLIVTPRTQNDSKIAIASWRRLEKTETLNLDTVNQFLTTNVNQSPEKIAQ